MSQTKHLIYEYQKDNELELDRIMNDFEPYIRTIINNMAMNTLNYEDKEEILSDAFFILWKNQYKIQTSVESYIAGVTRILVKERLRKRKITYDLTECESIASDFEIIEDDISENEFIAQCIKGLKEIDIKIITMFYYYSKTTKEISKELKISEINVRTKLFRIRNKIRKELNS